MLLRREFLLISASSPWLQIQFAQAAPVTVTPIVLGPTLLGVQIPNNLATCTELRTEIQYLDLRVRRLVARDYSEVDELRTRIAAQQAALNRALVDAQNAAKNADTALLINRVSSGFALTLLGIGIFASSPLVLGLAVGIQLLSMPAFLTWNAIALRNSSSASLLVGYTRDKTIYLGELVGENAGTSAGRIIGKTLSGIGLLIQAVELRNAANNAAEAQARPKEALLELESVQRMLSRFNTSNAVLGAFLRHELEGMRDSLQKYVDATSINNCLLLRPSPPTGPAIKIP